MATASNQRAEAEAVAFGEAAAHTPTRRGAHRARSVTSDLPLPPSATLLPVTQRDAALRASRGAAPARRALEWLSSGGHVTGHPPSLRDAHAYVHETAGHYEALLLKVPRMAWGYGWLLLKAVLHVIEWVTKSPVTFITAAVLITLAVFFL